MTAMGVVLALLLMYLVKEATSAFSFTEHTRKELAECNICDLEPSAEPMAESRISPLGKKKESEQSKTVLRKEERDAKANAAEKLECNVCELNHLDKEATQEASTSSETVANSSTSCDIADRNVFLPSTQCPSEMKWLHQLEVLLETTVISA